MSLEHTETQVSVPKSVELITSTDLGCVSIYIVRAKYWLVG